MRISRNRKLNHNISNTAWVSGSLLACAALLLPIAALIWLAASPDTKMWAHLWRTVLPTQVQTTLQLMLGVAVLTSIIGTGTAWLVTFCRFPWRGVFAWGLLLPLSIPTYLAAYSYSDLLDRAGPVFRFWSKSIPYPSIDALASGTLILSLVLFPYVFLAARTAFLYQSASLIEAARISGAGAWGCFWRISLPLARPAIVAGVALALMECLNDIGAMEHLGVQTLTIGVYDTWVVRGSLAGAAGIALTLLAFMGALLAIERYGRNTANGAGQQSQTRRRSLARFNLSRRHGILAALFCLVPMALGFIIPLLHFLNLATATPAQNIGALMTASLNAITLAALAAVLVCGVGLVLAFTNRLHFGAGTFARVSKMTTRFATHIAALGYAIPATILGLGVLIAATQIDALSGGRVVLIGSLAGLLFAYMVRFLPLSFGTIEAALARIPATTDIAAHSLGAGRTQLLTRIHIPLLRAPLLAASLLVFVDVMKELPATLILRPFNFDTLASLAYTQASLGQIEQAALPALVIIAVGLLPITILLRQIEKIR